MSCNDQKLQEDTVNWLQKVIRDDELDYVMLAESLIKIIKTFIICVPKTKELRVIFSDGYKYFEAYCSFGDNGETLSGVEITKL